MMDADTLQSWKQSSLRVLAESMHISAALMGHPKLIRSSQQHFPQQAPLGRTQGPCRAEL